MALAWKPVDVDTDPDDLRFAGDPAELVDAFAELLALVERPTWHRQAACRGKGPEQWFPARGESVTAARTICETCPVRADCLQAGMTERQGIWAGTSERERRQMRRTTEQDAAA